MLNKIKEINKITLSVFFQDIDNDGFHIMEKDELPLKSIDHNENITKWLNSHNLVRIKYPFLFK